MEEEDDSVSLKSENIYDSNMDVLEEPEDSDPSYRWDDYDFPFNGSSESDGSDRGWCMLGRFLLEQYIYLFLSLNEVHMIYD